MAGARTGVVAIFDGRYGGIFDKNGRRCRECRRDRAEWEYRTGR